MPISLSAPRRAHVALAAMLWPQRAEQFPNWLRLSVLIVFGTALLSVSAKANLPLPLVPMTLQSLMVLLIGAVYGARLGAATVLAYVAEGAIGLPVFAGPTAGLAVLIGPSGGYLAGFVAAAFVVGWLAERGGDRTMLRLFAVMAIGHFIIFALGFAWLAYGLEFEAERAWLVGVLPFLGGALIKNALGAFLLPTIRRGLDRRHR